MELIFLHNESEHACLTLSLVVLSLDGEIGLALAHALQEEHGVGLHLMELLSSGSEFHFKTGYFGVLLLLFFSGKGRFLLVLNIADDRLVQIFSDLRHFFLVPVYLRYYK